MAVDDEDLDAQIAVIGMAGRFPGAPDLDTFWSNLRNGVESIRSFTDDELLAAGEDPDRLRDPSYVRAGAPLADIDQFDAGFFGMSPRDAAVFDPQHRLFLECAWEAFEDAGYVGERIDGAVGVFASCGLSEYMFKNVLANERIATSVGEWLVRHTGNDTNFLATRVSYEMDLHGPSLNVQTACSSTLVGVHLACQSLLSGECDMALVGGAVVAPVQTRGYMYKEGEILSPDGHCRAFDARSAGTVISSACGAVLLKPLGKAIDDGDNVLAVIVGSAINNDGRAKVGYLAPSVTGQAEVVTEALAVAGIDPREVTYVEAHGTGTLIGDPIEITGLTRAYRTSTDDTQFCAIGSLKTNFGHTGEAAGIAALIKTVLALQHGEIPPSLHFSEPNPQADLPNSPFFVNAELRTWEPGPGGTRIAGITGLGAGGTNAHVIVEEAPPDDERPAAPARPQLLTLSARSAASLRRAADDLAAHLRADPDVDLADVAYTRMVGRKAFPLRRAVVGATPHEAADALDAVGKPVEAARPGEEPSVVFMMPGGGAQYPQMGRELYDTEPVYRAVIDQCAAALRRTGGIDLLGALFPGGDTDEAAHRFEAPSLALPALYATEVAMGRLLISWGVTPAALIGHSAGEYAAACLAGVVTLEDGLALVARRGVLFETLPKGAMLSIGLPEDEARALLPAGLDIAAVNAPALCVASGPEALIAELEAQLAERDVDATRIHIDVAAHSAMLEPILDEFALFCRTIAFRAPEMPYVSNLTGTWVTADEVTDPDYWVRHLRGAVRFSDGLSTLLADAGRVLLEVGPGRTLSGLARLGERRPAAAAPTLRHPKEQGSDVAVALAAVGRAWEAGVDLDPTALLGDAPRRRVQLPTYPFDRQRYWVEPDAGDARRPAPGGMRKRADVDEWFATPSWRRAITTPERSEFGSRPVVVIDDGHPTAARVAGRLATTRQVVRVGFGDRFGLQADGRLVLNPTRPDDWDALVEMLAADGVLPGTIVHMTALGPSRGRRRHGLAADDELAAYHATVARDHAGVLFLARALSARADAVRLMLVTSGVHALDSTDPLHPERALLHGAGRVIPRELGHVATLAVDIDASTKGADTATLVEQLYDEVDAEWTTDVVVLRRGERWIRTFEPVSLRPALHTPWVDGGVHLITGGLGGIALSIAQQIAKSSASPTLVLVGRTALPPEHDWEALVHSTTLDAATRQRIHAVQQLRTLGADVVLAAADVTDEAAMAAVVENVRRERGRITTVVHSAGVLHDALIALRTPFAESNVVDVKAKGALVLGRVFAKDPPDLLVLFSSVSSIIGLPGQVDYTAANAFLDAYAAKANRVDGCRALVVNWNAWREVGMAVDAARVERDQAPVVDVGDPTRLLDAVDGDEDVMTFSTGFSRRRHWLLAEHAVVGGEALIPGTGYLELLRSAVVAEQPAQPVELSDVFFISPFVVGDGEVRTLKVKLDRTTGAATVFSDTETAPHVTATVVALDDETVTVVDVAAIRARCNDRIERFDGYSEQPFMDFGPRWGSLRSVSYGDGEALVELQMPSPFVAELDDLWLHPALMDIATGSAQALIPGFDQDGTFYVPFSYGRVRSWAPLPARALSHVRLRQASGNDLATFDVTIFDEHGVAAVTVESFIMRRIAGRAALTSLRRADAPMSEAAGMESTVGSAMREGILPSEGVDAFDRIVASGLRVQVVASSVDVDRWMEKVDAEAHPSEHDDETGGVQYERPNITSDFVAPATAIERELATMWRDVLGVQRVGRDDDFFELGGQSLIAVRLFTRMKKRYSIDLPLSTLFEAPTIAQCASIVASKLGVVETPDDETAEARPVVAGDIVPPPAAMSGDSLGSIVTIQRGNASLLPFFCVHGSGGNVLNFRDMSQAMGRSQPFYGLQARGLDGVARPRETIEEMAADYLTAIRTIQPHGPYVLGGYSGGGLIAFEMAQQARAAGEEVALVFLLDTLPPVIPHLHQTTRDRISRLRESGFDYARFIFERRIDVWRRKRELARVAELVSANAPIPSDLRSLHVEDAFVRAASRYVRRPYHGHVVLFRAEVIAAAFRPLGTAYGWDEVVDGFELVTVPGNHDTLVLEPNATTLVQRLRATLEDIQTEHVATA